jgi:arylsulfatase
MRRRKLAYGLSLLIASFVAGTMAVTPVSAQQQPNIIMIMGDDIGIWNTGAYHRGLMAGRTPNLDQLAAEGMMFTDYYAEASCTAGRANFITGELPIRTGLTTVGQAGSPIGMPAEAPTIATALKSMGYATGQFGKNHLGDLNQFLPTVHGFDEFYGYLYHLDAMEDPCHVNYPQNLKATVGPRNMVHSYATNVDDPTVQPRWGKIGKQRIEDDGELCPKRMETVDDESSPTRSSSSTRPGRTASRSSYGSTRPGCTSSRTCRRNIKACATRTTAGPSKKPEWRNSTTSSVR